MLQFGHGCYAEENAEYVVHVQEPNHQIPKGLFWVFGHWVFGYFPPCLSPEGEC